MSSYVLEREIVTSARAAPKNCDWIDANSNAALVNTATAYHRANTTCCSASNPDNDLRKQLADLSDQVKMLKTDVEKKDQLIVELTNFKDVDRSRHHDKSYESYSADKIAADNAKRELATFMAKYEAHANDMCELRVKVQAKEERIGELKREIESLKNENMSMTQLINSQRQKLKELGEGLGDYESLSNKSTIVINSLQKENKEFIQKIVELESRIRTHLDQREEGERHMAEVTNKLKELAEKTKIVTGKEITCNTIGLDFLIARITEIVNESMQMKGKMLTASEHLAAAEVEVKASRDTITRLSADLSKYERDAQSQRALMDQLRAERDTALNTKQLLEREIDGHKERFNNVQAAWQATRAELESKQGRFSNHEANLKQLEYDLLYAKNCLQAFREQVATLLSDCQVKVEPSEEHIKKSIALLMDSSKERGLMIVTKDNKIQQLAGQLSEQITLYKDLEAKYHRCEQRVAELEGRLNSLDGEYLANEVLRENLKSDRVKYLSFLERIGHMLKVSQISADVGVDMNVDIVLARVEQLVKMESESLQDKQTNIYNLQRKCKSLKEQLDNKELHLDLLRKKLAALEEEKVGKSALEREVDDHVLMSKKFKIKVDKLTEQLNHLRQENAALKAQVQGGAVCGGRSDDKEIHRLMEKIRELELVKEKQSAKIAKLRDEMDATTSEITKTRTSSDSAVTALSQELRHLKQDLDKAQSREKQLADFRNIIAKMLGLEGNALGVADYEIIARIERVISAFNEGKVPMHVTREDGYSSTSSVGKTCSPHHHHNNNHHHHHHHHNRHESASPVRHRSKSPRKSVTIDPNSY